MDKDLVIDVSTTEVDIALLKNGRLIELNREENAERKFSVGDIYLGKVKKIMPALNAAFVDIGDNKDAFVHYLDLGLNYKALDYFVKQINPNRPLNDFYSSIKIDQILEKEGRIESVLTVGQPIMVQIVKEPISTKGSRLTSEISIAGRNMVLLPFADKVSISAKITSKEEKKRLEHLVYSILPKNYGVIVRTAAEGKKAAVLDAELKVLINKWEEIWPKLLKRKVPMLLSVENSRTTTMLRDLLNDSFANIFINDEHVYEDVRKYISLISPEQEKIVKLYKGHEPIFDHFDIVRQIKGSFGKVVPMRQGAYIVIEHTEAMHVIDVNSGIRVRSGIEHDQHALDVNMMAAEEISRQLRLRDMGGIIIIDFIDMDSTEHKNQLFKHMQELMQADRAKHNILPLTKFGLMQITRQRVRPATEVKTTEKCPSCNGTGEVSSTILVDEKMERELAFYVKEKNVRKFLLRVNPIIGAYVTKGIFNSIVKKWCRKYNISIKVENVSEFAFLQIEWRDEDGNVIS